MSEASSRWLATTAWILLVATSMVLMAIGLWRSMFFVWAPEPAMVEDARIGSLYIAAGSVPSVAASMWSHVRGNPVWVTLCVAAPAVLVGGTALLEPHSLLRHLAAVVAFPFAVAGIAEVLRVRGHRQRA